MNEHDPSATRSSFDESLGRIGASSLPEWPNFPFEEQLKNQQDDQQSTISATLTPKSRFYPTRSSVQRGSGFFVRLKRMWTLFPIQDISWIVAFSFTIGSTAFVVNGFFLLLALIDPETNFLTETPYATPASSVLGTLIFLIGGYAGFLEGLNFGEKEMAVTDGERSVQVQRLRVSTSTPQADDDSKEVQTSSLEPLIGDSAFIYLPTMHQLRTTYTHSLSFHAGWVQFLGTIVFSLATLTSLPGVLTSSPSLIPALNLLPATLGGLLFIIASVLQMLYAQEAWWMPQPAKGDWQVGFWNAIGSLGFTMAGALPVLGTETATYVGTLADFWGSWAFLIGSVIQLYIVMGYYA
ncbi:hypothetical protein L207DRAFT_443062 [Hyaloscypha variabilis F]|uniref:Integral membrane protein n=1 Tax=Hyaloscypha variabilis (strain UAMH 11265 / GT02V1 / F) TaxID=1149755 RepID=A0A2J6QX68_HYAVF|nr:hypothetical protein L207DRAFT_443062 [Hyaloscypha variabilis F]